MGDNRQSQGLAEGQLTIRITADPGDIPELGDVVTFLWDLNLLYELIALGQVDPRAIDPASASTWIFSRGGRRVPEDARMHVDNVRLGSPLEITTLLPLASLALGALWLLLQSLEKIYDMPVEHRLKESQARLAAAQARLAERELERGQPAERESPVAQDNLPPAQGLHAARHFDPLEVVEARLRRARIRMVDIDIEVSDDT